MPRRSASSKKPAKSKQSRGINRSDSKIKRWEKLDDIPLDEEDQFHASRDKILLEDDEVAGESDGDDDEVFGLKGMSDSEEDGAEEEEGFDEDEEMSDAADFDEPVVSKKDKKSKKSAKKSKKAASSSSEEEEEEEEETWGRSKSAYYSSNAAALESSDEEANELEEAEARRLQVKARGAMAEADFGLEDAEEVKPRDGFEDLADIEFSPVPAPEALPQDKQTLIRHLEKTSPETLALARDWEETALKLIKTQRRIEQLGKEESDALSLGMVHLHYQTLLTYATTLAFYLHVRATPGNTMRPDIILTRLLSLKQALATLEELDFALSDSEEDEDDGEEVDMEQLWQLDGNKGLEEDELEELLMDAEETARSRLKSKSKSKQEAAPSVPDEPPKKRRKTAAPEKSVLPVFDLVEPTFPSAFARTHVVSDQPPDDAYGESTLLQYADAADKNARRKSLRFHTAKIESAAARRHGARSGAAGGDDDVPYRERRKERELRLAKEAEKKKGKERGQGGDDLDEVEPQARVARRSGADSDGEEGEDKGVDGYYELVKRKVRESKEKKKADYEATQAAARPSFNENTLDGQRSVTRAILANKGLTPHRSKSVRNPRVKKRQKFEKAQRKVASQRPVWKGGVGDAGRYEGEKSGISKVVKSVRLG